MPTDKLQILTPIVTSVNGQTGDVTLTANDVDAIDKYNGMTPVECVYTHFGSQQTKIIYVEEGTLIPPSSSASDDIKNAWKRLLAIPLDGLAAAGPNSSFKDLIRGIGLLADNGVFGDLLSQSGNEFICYTDIFKQEVCLRIYNSKKDDKTITVYFNYYKQDKYQQVVYCISNGTFDDYCSFDEPVKRYSSNINATALTMPQTEMAAAPTKDMQIATKKYVDDSVSNPLNITSATVGQIAKISAVDDTGKPTTWETINIPTPFKPEGKSYLTFSSPNSFTLAVGNATKHWDGTLEYFASNKTWTTWDGTTTLSSVENDGEHVLYLRGTGNTVITGDKSNYRWVLTGSDIKCIGNIENLLDYATVEAGNHPTMANYCYNQMFFGCTSLTHAPDLPTTTLANSCYAYMFKGCTSLTQAPALPATTLANQCYSSMFQGCTSITKAPALPATTLANQCYSYMFRGCTALIQVPELPATTLVNYCYYYMFQGCTSLTKAPALQATTLADYCYEYMFADCTGLTQAPALPATTLAFRCYYNMFQGCTGLIQAPALPATTLASNCYSGMFQGCTGLIQAPALPATTLANNCYSGMFWNCLKIKLSSTQTGEYTQEYRIPSSGTGTTANNALTDMFVNTGGTFTGAPEINTTYYLSTDNMIVRDTEVATLNGYVGSMIDVAIGNAIGGSY